MDTLEASLAAYVDSLRKIIDAVGQVQAALEELRSNNRAVHERLSSIGRIIAFQPPTERTDHALAMLSWAVETGHSAVDHAERAIAPAVGQAPHLAVMARALDDVRASLQAAATAAAPQTRAPRKPTGDAEETQRESPAGDAFGTLADNP